MNEAKRTPSILIIAVFLVGLLLVPVGVGYASPSAQKAPAERFSVTSDFSLAVSQGVSRTVRVAIYNETNTTTPSYTTNGGMPHNNVTGLQAILQSYGVHVTVLNVNDILAHKLRTADFDVFAMPDNLPREKITKLVYDFWLGGGGLLTLDGSGLYLCYMGILPPESAGSDGYGTYWGYVGSSSNITARHPISKSFAVNDVISSGLGYLCWNWTALSSTSIAGDLTQIAKSKGDLSKATVLAFNPSDQGGKVVTMPLELESDYLPQFEPMFSDAVNWLCPRPKARILYDLTHVPWYGIDSWDVPLTHISNAKYYVWRDELVSRSYTVDKLYPSASGNLTLANLAPYDVLVEAAPSLNFTASEVSAVTTWISAGGGLLAMGDNPGLGDQNKNINYLLSPYHLRMNLTLGGSGGIYDVFKKHPASEGCFVISPSGPGALNFTGAAYPIVGDLHGNYILAGQAHGNGRILLQADLNIFVYEYIASNDNKLYSINIINWLGSGGAPVLLYTDEPASTNYYRTPVADALNDLQIPFLLTSTSTYLNVSLGMRPWDLVIVDSPWLNVNNAMDSIVNHVDTGGKFIMSGYRVDGNPSHRLWARLGFAYAADQPNAAPLDIWNAGHPVFNLPNKYNAAKFMPTYDYGDEGDRLMVFSNASSLAGYGVGPSMNNTNIVLRNDEKTLYNGYLIDQFRGDFDDSTYKDNFELWENEIAFMLRPTIDSPADIQYVSGTTGHTIVWHPSSYRLANYSLTIDGSDAGHGPWIGPSISLNVDSLAVGNHTCIVKVWDAAGYIVTDSVLVAVTAPPSGMSPTLIALVVAAAAIVLVLLVVLMKRSKK